MNIIPHIIQGGQHVDERGTISFVNDFVLGDIKRFYIIEHRDIDTIRAWQGHKKEQKWFYVVSGSFKIVLVAPDDWDDPAPDLECNELILSAANSQLLHIPGGFASGFRALEPGSKLLVYSDASIENSVADDFRYDKNKWYKW